jgi:hypothetical protein
MKKKKPMKYIFDENTYDECTLIASMQMIAIGVSNAYNNTVHSNFVYLHLECAWRRPEAVLAH